MTKKIITRSTLFLIIVLKGEVSSFTNPPTQRRISTRKGFGTSCLQESTKIEMKTRHPTGLVLRRLNSVSIGSEPSSVQCRLFSSPSLSEGPGLSISTEKFRRNRNDNYDNTAEQKRRTIAATMISKKTRDLISGIRRWWHSLKATLYSLIHSKLLTTIATMTIATILFFGCFTSSAMAVTGGRMGGSFGPSMSRSSSSSSSPSPSSSRSMGMRNLRRPTTTTVPTRRVTPSRPCYYGSRPHSWGPSRRGCRPGCKPYTRVYGGSPTNYDADAPSITSLDHSQKEVAVVVHQSVVSPVTVVVVSGMAVYAIEKSRMKKYNDAHHHHHQHSSVLGRGVSVARITVALDVPDKNDNSNSILAKMRSLSKHARTDTRRGVQDLVANVALELIRQQSAIVSACSSYQHFSTVNDAAWEFNHMAILERSKFEREAVNKFGGADLSYDGPSEFSENNVVSKATAAILMLLLSIEGDRTKIPIIQSRQDLNDALCRIAADVKVGECLLSAEILWAPEDRSEVLSRQQVAADYPDLQPI